MIKGARQIGGLVAGTSASAGLLLLVSPLLTRIYSPSAFGEFNSTLGIASLLATVISLSLPLAITLAHNDRESWTIMYLSFGITLIGAFVGVIVALMLPDIDGLPSDTTFAVVVAPTAVATVVFTSLRAIMGRYDNFRAVSESTLVDASVQASSQLAIGGLAKTELGLSYGYIGGKFVSSLILARRVAGFAHRPSNISVVLQKWLKHSLFLTPTTLLNQIGASAVAPVVGAFFGTAVAGQFSLASRVLAGPSILVGQAVSAVFFPKVSALESQNREARLLVGSVASGLVAISCPIFLAVWVYAEDAFGIVFGDGWSDAGLIARILSPWLALLFISSPLSSTVLVHRRNGQLFLFSVSEAVLRISALYFGFLLDDWVLGLVLYSSVGSLISMVTIGWCFRLSRANVTPLVRRFASFHLPFIIAVAACEVLSMSVNSSVIAVLQACLVATYSFLCLKDVLGLLG